MARKAKRARRAARPMSSGAHTRKNRSDARAVQGTFNRSDLVAGGVLNLVRDTIVTAFAGAKDVGVELRGSAVAAAHGAIRSAYRISGDLGAVAREAVRGTITAAYQIGGDVKGAANSAAQGAVGAAGEVRGDVATVARRAVEGSVAAREIGDDVGTLAKNTAAGAIEAADRIGSAAGRAVRTTLSTTVAGVRALVSEERPGPANGTPGAQQARRATGRPRRGVKHARARSRRRPR